MGEKCLEFISAYCKASQNPFAKVTAIQEIDIH
jgi:hypothetical protein